MKYTYYLLSLGCPKNEVDAEAMSGILQEMGFSAVADPLKAQFFIVNTCAFIELAREEAIEAILDLADYKALQIEKGIAAYLIVTGCLSQRYATEIYDSLPEVDSCLGTAEYHLIGERCLSLLKNEEGKLQPKGKGSLEHLKKLHKPSLDRKYAYLKVSEGCNNGCAFCSIPLIRGGQQSRPIEELVAEAKYYAGLGIEELILVAQDTTRYGSDLYGKNALVDLIKELLPLEGIRWIRLMYVYGDSFSEELIECIAKEKKILPYLDIPIQHGSNSILKQMRRRETKEEILSLVNKLRAGIPNLILRSTVIVGFPGESEEDFEELLELIRTVRFDRLGCFIFSPEEGTLAAKFQEKVDVKTAKKRYEAVMTTQQKISYDLNKNRIGKQYDILVEGIVENSPFYFGRSYAEAPDIDPEIYVLSQNEKTKIGDFVPCRIVDADEYSLTALTIEEDFDFEFTE